MPVHKAKSFIIKGTFVFTMLICQITESEGSPILVRPQFGIGYGKSSNQDYSGMYGHAGARFLFNATDIRRYGLELSYVDKISNGIKTDFVVVGIVLEKRLFNWFNMTVGTVGYIGMQKQLGNPFGILTNLGYEIAKGNKFNAFVTYRSEFIFEKPMMSLNSISLGIGYLKK